MTVHIALMGDAEAARIAAPIDDAGLGALRTGRGNLPLDRIDVRADITGLSSRVELTQEFVNAFDVPLEATYVFPLPDRAAVTAMRMTADGRVIEAQLQERGAAREEYDRAIAAGQRASIAEQERPDVFTMRVGNIVPGERVSVALTLVCPLSYEDGEATFRFPLVVAPRYIPGTPLAGAAVGDGYAEDTDAVPDASRITPPVLLPGFPNPVRLTVDIGLDPAGLPLTEVRSSLHAVSHQDGRVHLHPGERANRDLVLRLRYAGAERTDALLLVPDAAGSGGSAAAGSGGSAADGSGGTEGTYLLTVLPPAGSAPARPRDVVLVLDRSGSMSGWKMVAARRAAARIVDTLTGADRFAVLTFDDVVDRPDGLPSGLVAATDRHRYRAVEHLARVDARGGTEILQPLREALGLLTGPAPTGQGADPADRGTAADEGRDAVLVLVTDGQVGNEDEILRELDRELRRVRVHTVGIDQAVNAGFLGRLAAAGAGRCELVESEDRLDEAMDVIHRRISAPLVTGLSLVPEGMSLVDDTASPVRLPDLFPGVPLVLAGRYRGSTGGSLTLRGSTRDGRDWSTTVPGQRHDAPAVPAQWARAHLRDLEDRYVVASGWGGNEPADALERRIVGISLRFAVLCRFTAYVAVDSRVVAGGTEPHRVVQPVEAPAGWGMFDGAVPGAAPAGAMRMMPASLPASAQRQRSFAASAEVRAGQSVEARPEPAGEHPELRAARGQAAGEARRLREAVGLAGYQRLELLADLGSRLEALLRHLGGHGVPEPAYSALRVLVKALGAGGDPEALWAQAIGVLDEFASTAAGGGPGAAPAGGRRSFWKRG